MRDRNGYELNTASVIGALLYQVVTLLTDLCYGWLDPRVRLT